MILDIVIPIRVDLTHPGEGTLLRRYCLAPVVYAISDLPRLSHSRHAATESCLRVALGLRPVHARQHTNRHRRHPLRERHDHRISRHFAPRNSRHIICIISRTLRRRAYHSRTLSSSVHTIVIKKYPNFIFKNQNKNSIIKILSVSFKVVPIAYNAHMPAFEPVLETSLIRGRRYDFQFA